jgi:hypothetical protein
MVFFISKFLFKKGLFMTERQEFFIVPYWIESAMTRNSMQLGDVLNYEKLRSVVSLNDAAELLALQNLQIFTIEKLVPYMSVLLSSWRESAQGAYLTELDSVLPSLSCGDCISAGLIERLKSGDPASITEDSLKYKIVACEKNTHCIVLDNGFIEYQSLANFTITFSRSLIDSLKFYMDTKDIASLSFFKHYVRSLSQLKQTA